MGVNYTVIDKVRITATAATSNGSLVVAAAAVGVIELTATGMTDLDVFSVERIIIGPGAQAFKVTIDEDLDPVAATSNWTSLAIATKVVGDLVGYEYVSAPAAIHGKRLRISILNNAAGDATYYYRIIANCGAGMPFHKY